MRPLLSRIRAFVIMSVLCGAFPAVSAGQFSPDTVDSRADAVAIIEEPGRFLVALLEHVLPLTGGGAEYEVLR